MPSFEKGSGPRKEEIVDTKLRQEVAKYLVPMLESLRSQQHGDNKIFGKEDIRFTAQAIAHRLGEPKNTALLKKIRDLILEVIREKKLIALSDNLPHQENTERIETVEVDIGDIKNEVEITGINKTNVADFIAYACKLMNNALRMPGRIIKDQITENDLAYMRTLLKKKYEEYTGEKLEGKELIRWGREVNNLRTVYNKKLAQNKKA